MTKETENGSIRAGSFFDGVQALPADPVVAMAYVPFQRDKRAYDDELALKNGTLFQILNKPFLRGCLK